MEGQRRHEGPHVIPSMERIPTNAKTTFIFMGMERFSPIRGGHLSTSNLRGFRPIRESHLFFYEWRVFRVKTCTLAALDTVNTSASSLVKELGIDY